MPENNVLLDRPFLPVARPFLWGNEARYVAEAVEGGWLSSQGGFVRRFEEMFAEALGVPHAVTTSSGTTALHLALETLGIGEGDEVIVPNFAMVAPILAVLYCGARPVPVEVDATWNIDPGSIEAHLTERTRAILVVHTYGHPAEMERLTEIAQRHGLYLVEDAAEALGATVRGSPAGTFGDIACFSFYANKIITTGEGGMLVTANRDLARRARWKRSMCFGEDGETRFTHREVGFNYRLTNLQAAVGVAQMEHLEEAIAAKIDIARQYDEALRGVRGLTLPPEAAWAKNVYWVYGVVVEEDFGLPRAAVQAHLRESGIQTRRFFNTIHRQPLLGEPASDADFPRSIHLAENGFYVPSFVGMTSEDIYRTAECLHGLQARHG